MAIHTPITGAEAADRLAIGELYDAYAHCADTRDAKGQMALFTKDTRFVVYMDARNPEPTQELCGPQALAPDVIADDDLSAGQLAEPAVTGIVSFEIGVDGSWAPRSPMACADLDPGTRDSAARSPCG